ncbi:MAG: class I SAM-dependent methyltransferase [Chloroflexi bacterium]|nr:class I SAM-dependent methyltransferase [Chloroflexota bacterium]
MAGGTRETKAARSRYNRNARLYDLSEGFVEKLLFRRHRARLWSVIPGGCVLEVGVGTGKNMPYYPSQADVVAIDLSEEMLRRARKRAQALGLPMSLACMDAQSLAFVDDTFDAVVASFVFCSVPDAVRGLREVLRVSKPGAKVLLLVHVRSGNPLVGLLMDLANPLMVRMAGANINRDTVANVAISGLKVEDVADLWAGIVKLISARADKPFDGRPQVE